MRSKHQAGQAVILVLVALSLFVIGAIGLAIDGSQLYAQRQLAQNAADAATLAGMMSIFNNTNTAANNNLFGNVPNGGGNPAPLPCPANSDLTPCYFARQNGFDPANGDTVKAEFFGGASAIALEPGVTLSGLPVNLMRMTLIRPVPTSLMRFISSTAAGVAAQATAAIVDIPVPVPILVLHPTAAASLQKSGMGANPGITICGGPQKSIQVDSCAGTGGSVSGVKCDAQPAVQFPAIINLSRAGPADNGSCTTGTGADFGNSGTPVPPDPPNILLGSTGNYIEPATPIEDPLGPAGLNVVTPTDPGPPSTAPTACNNGLPSGCPNPCTNCTLYYPGAYPAGISLGGGPPSTAVFQPGLYFIKNGGFTFGSNSNAVMANPAKCTGPVPANTYTGCGMVIFLAASGGSGNTFSATSNAGKNAPTFLLGSDLNSTYDGVLVYVDHTAPARVHNFSGGGQFTLSGTFYMTNTKATMLADASHFQTLDLGGNAGSGTEIDGEVIVDELHMHGTPAIVMHLNNGLRIIHKVALVR
ncbi:MAG TPA: Tad domain-containing protein [Bryobacterales bacterium]|nr:Tad domain-containing protein [Bryobacterales bacterium]